MSQISLVFGQISQGGKPVDLPDISPKSDFYEILEVDTSGLSELRSEGIKTGPLQFAWSVNVNFNPLNSGKWFQLNNGTWVWTTRIKSPGALSLHLFFDNFELVEGEQVFLFSPDQKYKLGAFTKANNKSSGSLVTQPIPGDEIVLQYITAQYKSNSENISIGQVGHGFIDLYGVSSKKDQYYNTSGPCNIDVNCPEGDLWQDEKRAVVRLFIDNETGPDEVCTGVLMNNTSFDGKPYILTAGHCIEDAVDASRTLAIFGYESPVCDGSDGFVNLSVSGSDLRATISNLDFTLAELTEYPPVYYQPYYAGWNASSTAPASSVSIHHPNGDVKKISVDNDAAVTANWLDYDAGTFWRIIMWDIGTTEPGSSGGPLFDSQGFVVGTLAGGQASCGNSINDYFQKFSASWNRYSNPSQQLESWLDPLNQSITTLEGYDPYGSGEMTCDTVFNIESQENMILQEFTVGDPDDGFWTGHNVHRITQYAEMISPVAGDEFVEADIHVAQVSNNSLLDSVTFKIWNGSTHPETILALKRYPLVYFEDSTEFRISFDTVIQFSQPFWIGYEIKYDNPVSGPLTDQFALFQAEPRSISEPNTALFFKDGIWSAFDTNSIMPMHTALSIKARMCSDIPNLRVEDHQDLKNKELVLAFPNPTSEMLTLRFTESIQGPAILRIFSMDGSICYEKELQQLEGDVNLNFPNLRDGLYLFQLRGKDFSETIKLLIIH